MLFIIANNFHQLVQHSSLLRNLYTCCHFEVMLFTLRHSKWRHLAEWHLIKSFVQLSLIFFSVMLTLVYAGCSILLLCWVCIKGHFAESHYTEWLYIECQYTKCHYAECLFYSLLYLVSVESLILSVFMQNVTMIRGIMLSYVVVLAFLLE